MVGLLHLFNSWAQDSLFNLRVQDKVTTVGVRVISLDIHLSLYLSFCFSSCLFFTLFSFCGLTLFPQNIENITYFSFNFRQNSPFLVLVFFMSVSTSNLIALLVFIHFLYISIYPETLNMIWQEQMGNKCQWILEFLIYQQLNQTITL